jgi:hypothetical protein
MDWLWPLDASRFLARNHGGAEWIHVLEKIYSSFNLILAFAFFAIPVTLNFLDTKERADPPTTRVLALFRAFIVLCGLTHLANVLVFYWAPYPLFTVSYALIALALAFAAFRLMQGVHRLLRLPSRESVHEMNERLQAEVLRRDKAEQELACRKDMLSARVKALEEMLKANSLETLEGLLRTNQWIHERNAAIQELNKMLSEWEAL